MNSIEAYRIYLFVHVVAAIALGSTLALPIMQAAAERSGVGSTKFMLRFSQRLYTVVVYPAFAVIPIVGFAMIFNDRTGYDGNMPRWLEFAILWCVAMVVMTGTILRSSVASAIELLEPIAEGRELPASYQAIGSRIQALGGLLGFSIIGITFLMVMGREGAF